MGERILYWQRRNEAINSNGEVWSFIFDGMSSYSTHLPIGGHAKEFATPLKTHIQGCIAHAGNETTFYWSLPNLMVGASFQIHCLHAELQRVMDDFEKTGKPLPKKIYIQVCNIHDL